MSEAEPPDWQEPQSQEPPQGEIELEDGLLSALEQTGVMDAEFGPAYLARLSDLAKDTSTPLESKRTYFLEGRAGLVAEIGRKAVHQIEFTLGLNPTAVEAWVEYADRPNPFASMDAEQSLGAAMHVFDTVMGKELKEDEETAEETPWEDGSHPDQYTKSDEFGDLGEPM